MMDIVAGRSSINFTKDHGQVPPYKRRNGPKQGYCQQPIKLSLHTLRETDAAAVEKALGRLMLQMGVRYCDLTISAVLPVRTRSSSHTPSRDACSSSNVPLVVTATLEFNSAQH
jgi:hypothetical protein